MGRPDRGLFKGRCTQRNRTDACCYKSIEAKEMREEKKRDAHFTACRHQTRQEEQKEEKKGKKKRAKKKIDFYFIASIAYPTAYSVGSPFSPYPNAHTTSRRTLSLPLGWNMHTYLWLSCLPLQIARRVASLGIGWLFWLSLFYFVFFFSFCSFPFRFPIPATAPLAPSNNPHFTSSLSRSPFSTFISSLIMCMAPRFRVRRLLGLFHVYRSSLYTRHRSCWL